MSSFAVRYRTASVDGSFQFAYLESDQSQLFREAGQHDWVGDQAGLVALCGADVGELVQSVRIVARSALVHSDKTCRSANLRQSTPLTASASSR
jgi:hypothetical protein